MESKKRKRYVIQIRRTIIETFDFVTEADDLPRAITAAVEFRDTKDFENIDSSSRDEETEIASIERLQPDDDWPEDV